MKKALGFASGVAAMALAGTGIYMMMSKDTKKQMCKTVNYALDDASKMINKKAQSLNTK